MLQKVCQLRKKGVTILLVTHDLTSVLQFCNYAFFLSNGRKMGEGIPKDVIDLYKQVVSQANVTLAEKKPLHTQYAESNNHTWKENYKINDSMLEYGDKGLEIIDFRIAKAGEGCVSVIRNDEAVSISVKVKANQEVIEPIVAFSIKDIKGRELLGTNTLLKKYSTGVFSAKNIYEISFLQTIPLRAGKYTLSLGCTKYRNGNLHIYHRLYDVLLIDIISELDTGGLVYINPKITLIRK